MQSQELKRGSVLNLRAGEVVEVRSAKEILATLDNTATLDALPFMPEMLKYCGKRFTVFKRADKTCDTIAGSGLRRMCDAVHLDGLRCDGEAHGGCEAGCLFFWKEAWLKRDDANNEKTPSRDEDEEDMDVFRTAPPWTEETFSQTTRRQCGEGALREEQFVCQATRLLEATSPLPWSDIKQYVRDLHSRNVSLTTFIVDGIRQLAIWFINTVQHIRRKSGYPFWQGRLTKTPAHALNLQPGETVQVKTLDEIVQTLDTRNSNRGMSFNHEMVKYCGKTFKVLRRVRKIINERTGKMMEFTNDCIILEGVTCESHYHKFCPRSIYPYWREIWLNRVHER